MERRTQHRQMRVRFICTTAMSMFGILYTGLDCRKYNDGDFNRPVLSATQQMKMKHTMNQTLVNRRGRKIE